MTNRERILAALNGKETDRLPWAPLIDGYFISSLPKQGLNMEIIEAMRYIGNDIIERHVGIPSHDMKNIERRLEKSGNRTRLYYDTPVGSIYKESERVESTEYGTKHLVETLEDMKVLSYIAEHTNYVSNSKLFKERDHYIGDSGIATVSLTPTPIQEMLQELAGVENTVYLMADYPDEMDELLQIMHERNKKMCYTYCEYDTPVVFQYEDTSTTVMNKLMLNDYELPCVNDYAKIFHENGKRYITHMCGKLDGFKNEIAAADMDGIDSVCPPTTGDLCAWDARDAFGDKIIIGGIEPPSLSAMTVEETLNYVVEIIRKMKNKKGFILSTGDAVPYGTPIENMAAVTKLIALLGKNSLGTDVDDGIIQYILHS
ncbi:MAG: hypothetical protein KH828_09105 [Clostridiales bacterium]|nr:hypothetical protein [Clostridiales bacterium]